MIALFWAATWLVGEFVRPGATVLAAVAVAVPTLFVASLAMTGRIADGLKRAVVPPRASVHETQAASRDRRIRLSGVVLTGIVALLLFDRFTTGGGVMAGLVGGLLGALGAADWFESRRWDRAERERETRIFVMIRPDALSPRLGAREVYELPRPGADRDLRRQPSPFDLEI